MWTTAKHSKHQISTEKVLEQKVEENWTAQPVNLPSALLTLHIFLKDFPQKADARLPNERKIPTAKSDRIQAIRPAKTCPKRCGNICQQHFRSQGKQRKVIYFFIWLVIK